MTLSATGVYITFPTDGDEHDRHDGSPLCETCTAHIVTIATALASGELAMSITVISPDGTTLVDRSPVAATAVVREITPGAETVIGPDGTLTVTR